jgi:hypothetical protein
MLSQIFDKEKTQSIIDVMPDSMIVWKVVTNWRYLKVREIAIAEGMKKECWHPAFTFGKIGNGFWYPFKGGYNENNVWGFHCFVKKDEIQQYKKHFGKIIHIGYWDMVSAKIDKKDIMKIGLDRGLSLTILTSRIIMPTCPNTDITKEFAEEHDLIEECDQAIELMSNEITK